MLAGDDVTLGNRFPLTFYDDQLSYSMTREVNGLSVQEREEK
jgi:hypothetical protein